MTYWLLFTLAVVVFAAEVAVYLRQKQLYRRSVSRQLRRSINRYSA